MADLAVKASADGTASFDTVRDFMFNREAGHRYDETIQCMGVFLFLVLQVNGATSENFATKAGETLRHILSNLLHGRVCSPGIAEAVTLLVTADVVTPKAPAMAATYRQIFHAISTNTMVRQS